MTGKIDGPNGPGSREQKEQSRSQEWPKPQLPKIHPGALAAVLVAMIMTGLFAMLFFFGGDDQAALFDDEFFDQAMIDEFEADQLLEDEWPSPDEFSDKTRDAFNDLGMGGSGLRCDVLTTDMIVDFFSNGLGVAGGSESPTALSDGIWIDDPDQIPEGTSRWQRCMILHSNTEGVTASGSGLMMIIETFELDAGSSPAATCDNPAWRYANEFIVGCTDGYFISIYGNEAPRIDDEDAFDAASIVVMNAFMAHHGADSYEYDVGAGWTKGSSGGSSQGERTQGGG